MTLRAGSLADLTQHLCVISGIADVVVCEMDAEAFKTLSHERLKLFFNERERESDEEQWGLVHLEIFSRELDKWPRSTVFVMQTKRQ